MRLAAAPAGFSGAAAAPGQPQRSAARSAVLTWQCWSADAPAATQRVAILGASGRIAVYNAQRLCLGAKKVEPRVRRGSKAASMARCAAPAAAGQAVWPALRANDFDTFLLDQDGVLWRGDDPIAGTLATVARLQDSGKRVFFVRARGAACSLTAC